MTKPKHNRKSIRWKGYDYTQAGAYFVTVCSWQRVPLFGVIVDGEMVLNAVGEIVQDEWSRTEAIRPNVKLGEFVVMPNHFHAIVVIRETQNKNTTVVGAHRRAPTADLSSSTSGADTGADIGANIGADSSPPLRRKPGSLGSIMAGFKSAATKRINQMRGTPGNPVWQRNYYDRVIRDEREWADIRDYILTNPSTWAEDKENPDLHST